jgi:hypothetical protein
MTRPLSERLRALVLQHASVATLTCPFTPGGKLHGIGIPSVLWCLTCQQAGMWHDVAAAAVLAARVEAFERLPFQHDDAIHVSVGDRRQGTPV